MDWMGRAGITERTNVAVEDRPAAGDLMELVALSFRCLRKIAGEHAIVKELVALRHEAAEEIERLADLDADFRQDLVRETVSFARLGEAIASRNGLDETYSTEMHERLRRLAQRLAKESRPALRKRVERVVELAEPFVGKSALDIRETLKPSGEPGPPPSPTDVAQPLTKAFPSAVVIAAGQRGRYAGSYIDIAAQVDDISILEIVEYRAADRAIEKKAQALGGLPGAPQGDTYAVPGGYVRSYEGCDIYYSKAHGAHEVHGDIRAKYNALGGPAGILGLPVTDESGTPDGVGRYNHFANDGSIYWTPNSGPMMVRGAVRSHWASQGWEMGGLGYPVADEYRLPGLYPADHPDLAWSLFQNGAILSKGSAAATALAADITPAELRGLIRTFVDRGLKQASSDLGLEAQVDLLAVSGWSYGFWQSQSRTVTFRLYGFHDNGILPDSTFEIEIRLRFALAWPMAFTYPTHKTLIAALDWIRVHASGLGNGQLSTGIADGIYKTFYRGGADPEHSEVPNGAVFIATFPTGANQTGSGNIDVIDVLTTAQGGVQVLVNPLPPIVGAFRRQFAQNQIEAFLQNY
jgi:LGFP repeat